MVGNLEEDRTVGRRIIDRPRLIEVLSRATPRIILLVAPAGYGKTTLARQWLEDKEHSWYRTIDSSTDVAALAIGVAVAADRFGGPSSSIIESRLRASRDPAQEATLLGELLAENFGDWPPNGWLAIDDYHLLSSSPCAEQFVDALVSHVDCSIILTARQRPVWATPRRILYGELFELGQNVLAMDQDEARALLGRQQDPGSDALLSLAQGWPAVLGLISKSARHGRSGELTTDVYDYFAEELFQQVDASIKDRLPCLVIPPLIDREIATQLFGNEYPSVLEAAEKYGFVARIAPSVWDMHPLVRTFLETKLDLSLTEPVALASSAASLYLNSHRWDEAFSVIERFELHDRLSELLTSARNSLLLQGRVATLARWLKFAELRGVRSAILMVTEAELAFRGGKCGKAETLAREATASAADGDELAYAYLIAGKSAHFRERLDEALRNFSRAEEHATSASLLREALWGECVASLDFDLARAVAAWKKYGHLDDHRIDDEVRLANARMAIARRLGKSVETFDDVKHIVDIASRADPAVHCAFLNVYGGSLVSGALYEEAYDVADRELSVARKFRLDFVRPHALLTKASACLGLRELSEARRLIRDSQSTSPEDDPHVHLFSRTLKMQMLLAEGAVAEALAEAQTAAVAFPSRTIQAEFVAMQAFVHVVAGQNKKAMAIARHASSIANYAEAKVIVACVRLVAGLGRPAAHVDRLARRALGIAFDTGNLHDLISAYRAPSEMLATLARREDLRDSLNLVVTRGHDWRLAAERGISVPEGIAERRGSLSPREREVYRLLADGRSNREIAEALFISEVTAKVHVRRILEKVGARSRTEAAIRLARAPELLDA